MPRIQAIDSQQAPASVAPLLAAVKQAVGFIPNFYRQTAVAPAVLKGYLAFNEALSGGELPPATREAIALAVAEANGCDYCLSAHSAVAAGLKIDAEERNRNRQFQSADAARAAALRLAREVLSKLGHIDDTALADARGAGLSDAAVLEVVAVVSINILTNYLNDVAAIAIDFPLVRAGVLS
jgi:uncharacterized peroxidase-related enzyme